MKIGRPGSLRECAGKNMYQKIVFQITSNTNVCFALSQLLNFVPLRYKVNGLDGWGVSEWEYRHKGGKQTL